MGNDRRHQRTEEGIGKKNGRYDHQRRAKRAPRRLQQDQDPDDRHDIVLQDRRPDPRGDSVIEDIEVKRCGGADDRKTPLPERNVVLGRPQQDRSDQKDTGDRNPPDGNALLRAVQKQKGQHGRNDQCKAKLCRRACSGIGRKCKKQRKGQMDRAGFGIVEDTPPDNERNGRRDPKLKQRPQKCRDDEEGSHRSARGSATSVGGRNKFIQFFLTQTAFSGSRILDSGGFELLVVAHGDVPVEMDPS